MAPDFFMHGLRHIMTTKLRALKINPYVARLLLDHAEAKDAHSGYEHLGLDHWRPEMEAALERWCAHIEELVTPGEGVAVLR